MLVLTQMKCVSCVIETNLMAAFIPRDTITVQPNMFMLRKFNIRK